MIGRALRWIFNVPKGENLLGWLARAARSPTGPEPRAWPRRYHLTDEETRVWFSLAPQERDAARTVIRARVLRRTIDDGRPVHVITAGGNLAAVYGRDGDSESTNNPDERGGR